MKILPSALKHGITPGDIDELISSPNHIEIPLPPGKFGERSMLVGFIQRFDYPIEVGLEHPLNEESQFVFHAAKAREPFISVFKEKYHGQEI